MLLTALTLMFAAAEVQAPEVQPQWAVNYALTSPSVIGASFNLTPLSVSGLGGTGVLGSVSRPSFTNALSLERALGEHVTGIAALTFGFAQFERSVSSVSGGGMLGVHWYAWRPLDGFWAGPEALFQLTTLQLPSALGPGSSTQAVGVRARAGWTQRFGAHFLVSAAAGVGANVSWFEGTTPQTTLTLAVDGTLLAGLMF